MSLGDVIPHFNIGSMSWANEARCVGAEPGLFFKDSDNETLTGPMVIEAYCNHCPVRFECLAYAMENNERFGIWGGMTPNQRERLRKRDGRESE